MLNSADAIVSRFQSLSQQMAERSDLLQKSIAQSQSVQESLESLLQSVAEIEKNLEGEQPAMLSSSSIQDSLATSTVRVVPGLPRLRRPSAGAEPCGQLLAVSYSILKAQKKPSKKGYKQNFDFISLSQDADLLKVSLLLASRA